MKYTREFLEPLVASSRSIQQLIATLGLRHSGGMHKLLSTRIKSYGLSTAHFVSGKINSSNKKQSWSEVLIKRPKGMRRQRAVVLRRALLEMGREYVCVTYGCGNRGIWLAKKLVLQINHCNGNITDDSPDNLEFLCPNCHTQTDGYGGSKGNSGVDSH